MIKIIIQARMGSSRLPGKMAMPIIDNKSPLELMIERVRCVQTPHKLIVATTHLKEDDVLEEICKKLKVSCYRGHPTDVLNRYYHAAQFEGKESKIIVRLTGDCPLHDPCVIDQVIQQYLSKTSDYVSNVSPPTFPDGLDVEVFSFEALKKAYQHAKKEIEREHVTPYIRDNSVLFSSENYACSKDYSHHRWTLDEPEDFEFIQTIFKTLYPENRFFNMNDVLNFIKNNEHIKSINQKHKRNEAYEKQKKMAHKYYKSESLLAEAEKAIPLGSQTFSKSKTQYPFGVSPFFATHAKGAYVYDVDGNKYLDFVNSLAAITLGYQDPDVLSSVKNQLEKGSIFTLSSPLECQVAEKIIDMVPCAEMVRFGKNGTDATSAAIRLARAYTNRDHIAVCGYHGWQDWYIGSTTRDLGVPKNVKDLTHKFEYNNVSSLEDIFQQYSGKIAAVIMEPVNLVFPENGYLQKVQSLAKKHGAVLIFDETITGFRYANGGGQEFFNITPDLACFGKGLANGYPLSAVVGKREIMKKMEDIFFSGTFGGETLSLAAADAVLNKLQSEPVVKTLWSLGETLQNKLSQLIKNKELTQVFNVSGYPVWSFFNINDTSYATSYELKTLMLQEMFKNNILALGTHNISYAHNENHIVELIQSYDVFFEKVKVARNIGIGSLLDCKVLEPLFKVR